MLLYKLTHIKLKTIVVIMAIFILSGCPSLTNQQQSDKIYSSAQSSNYYLNQARQSTGTEKIDWQLLAVRALIHEGNYDRAKDTLNHIALVNSDYYRSELRLVSAELALAQGNINLARDIHKGISAKSLTEEQYIRYCRLVAKVAASPTVQLRAYVELERFITNPTERQQLHDDIWNLLSSLSEKELGTVSTSGDNNIIYGWLKLTLTFKQNQNDGDLLRQSLISWQQAYPQNPFATLMPTNLANIISLRAVNNTHIALLLPMGEQTKAISDAIHAGFTDAMKTDNASNIQLDIYDTSAHDIAAIFNQIQQQSTTLVIGPLLKQNVEQAIQINNKTDMLVLNIPETVLPHNNVCYFSLAPEDEARNAAEKIIQQGSLSPLLIVPSSNLGKRIVTAFDQKWQQLGGGNITVHYFSSVTELNNAINRNNGIAQGSPLHPELGMPGTTDAIYITATQNELVMIKSLLDMSASSRTGTKLFASSRSHQTFPGTDTRLEMDGILFSEIPLIAGIDKAILQNAQTLFSNDFSQIRLYALGWDAWKLAQVLPKIRSLPNYSMQGLTGNLSAGGNCVIQRQLIWLFYNNGKLNVSP